MSPSQISNPTDALLPQSSIPVSSLLPVPFNSISSPAFTMNLTNNFPTFKSRTNDKPIKFSKDFEFRVPSQDCPTGPLRRSIDMAHSNGAKGGREGAEPLQIFKNCRIKHIPGRCFRLPETGGSRWKESGNILDPTGKYRNNNRNMEAVFRSYVLGILPMTSSPFPAKNSLENGYKS